MMTSEALSHLYNKMFNEEPNPDEVSHYEKLGFNRASQSPDQADELLTSWMFEVPASVFRIIADSPEEAKAQLIRAIGGAKGFETIVQIESGAPTLRDFEDYLKQINFFQLFPGQ
jgi:hypothetical protein